MPVRVEQPAVAIAPEPMTDWCRSAHSPRERDDAMSRLTSSTARSSGGVRAWSRESLAVDHPRSSELIDEHDKTGRPKGLLDRHLHRPVFRQCMEDAFGIFGVVDAERHREALHWFVAVGRSVGTHQYLVADRQAGMHDLLAPPGWRPILHWRAL